MHCAHGLLRAVGRFAPISDQARSASLLFRLLPRCFANVPFLLQDVGEGIAEVEVVEWKMKEGQHIEQFAPVCEIQTDKATLTITSRYEGVVTKLPYKPGDIVKVHSPLYFIETNDPSALTVAPPVASPAPPAASTLSPSPPSGPRLSSPAAEHLIRLHHLETAPLEATGPRGRLLKGDVLRFLSAAKDSPLLSAAPAAMPPTASPTPTASTTAPAAPTAPLKPFALPPSPQDTVESVKGIQRMMVQSMTESKKVPHLGVKDELEMDALMEIRSSLKPWAEKRKIKISFMPFLIKAASLALLDHPVVNSSFLAASEEIVYHSRHHIGLAMDTPRGLIVPVIKSVEHRSVVAIAEEISRLQGLGSKNQLGPNDIDGATFSVSNVGTIGGTYAFPLIVPPQVAIVALGKIQETLRYDSKGSIVKRHVMNVSMSSDHRIIDDSISAHYLQSFKGYVESPASMMALLQ